MYYEKDIKAGEENVRVDVGLNGLKAPH